MCKIIDEHIIINNFKLFYNIVGEGESLVFIHGNFNDSTIWKYQMEYFSHKYKVIIYDQRGYGKSDTPTSIFSHHEDLKNLLDLRGVKKATIIGSSSGGSIALDFALRYPELVNGLVLVAPAINGYRYPLRLIIEAIKSIYSLKSRGFDFAVEKFIDNKFWSYFIPSENKKEARELILQNIKNKKNFYSWDFKLAIPEKPYAVKRLGEIRIPTLVVLADKDIAFNKKVGKYIHKGIVGSDKIVLSDCGHIPFIEKPDEFNARIEEFLDKIIE